MKKQDAELFLREVEALVNPEINYIEALVLYAERKGMEVEVVAEIAKKHQVIKSRLREDAEDLNLMTEKTRRLPIDDSDD